jgi:[acyl-carrier-protein] S-malonyltransferase
MKKRAVAFAGQGAQSVGMGKDLAQAHPECRALFDRANAVLGLDLARLCFEGPLEQITRSDNCQPAIFVMSVACFTALKKTVPDLDLAGTAGLSLGEWTALHAAGALTFEDTLKVLRARGRFMQEACEERQGGMVSVMGLAMPELEKICAATGVEIANLNAPDQTVLSGEKTAIGEADKLAQAAGAKRTFVLNVAGAFHSRLMASAAAKLEPLLAGVAVRAPAIPVVANATGQPHGGADDIRRLMVKQVTSPVRWVAGVEWFRAAGVKEYVECGPGKVLAGLIKRIDKDAVPYSIQDCASLDKTVSALRATPAA